MNKLFCTKSFVQCRNFIFSNFRHISKNTFDISGVYPPIITTFDASGNISFDKLQFNLQKWKSIPFRGLVVFGTTGESSFLSKDERVKLMKCIKGYCAPEKLLIAGTGCESTQATIELTNTLADCGANAALVVNPCYNKSKMTDDALYDHYIRVSDASKIPIIVYNVPSNTNIDMPPSLLIKLADHPNIIGLKESGGDITKIGYIVHKTKDKNFQVLAGSAGFLYTALCVGCVGGIMALANSLGGEVYELFDYTINGNHTEARNLQHRLIGPNLCVTKWFSIPGVKASMDLKGYYGGSCRAPLKTLSANEVAVLKDEFKSNGFL